MTTARLTATLGIDLAAQATNTGICRIDWFADGTGYVHTPGGHADDHDLLAMIGHDDVTKVGIDAPFGWPITFVDALVAYRDDGAWPDEIGNDEHQRAMRLRETDRAVRTTTKLVPLSVSTDRIGVAAMRCARLLAAYHQSVGTPVDRTGAGHCVEVYPAATLQRWGVSPKFDAEEPGSYKGASVTAKTRREWIIEEFVAAGTGWLEIPEKTRIVCVDDDHCLDAMVAALTARAAELGRVTPTTDPGLAALEGWVVLPADGPIPRSCRS